MMLMISTGPWNSNVKLDKLLLIDQFQIRCTMLKLEI